MEPSTAAPTLLPWLTGGLVALLILLAYGIYRRLQQSPEVADPGGLSLDLRAIEEPHNWEERTDRAFERIVDDASLGVNVPQALGWMLLVGVALAIGVYFWREDPLLALFALPVGMALVGGVYYLVARYWRRRMQEQLPDSFFLLARSLRAGLSLEQSITLAGQQTEKPIGREFRRCGEHLRLGVSIPVALQLTARRVGLLDFNIFVSLVILYRRVGGNLAMLLDRVATSTRDRNLFRGHVRAATALGRLSGIFIALAGPALFLGYYLFQPEYINRFLESSSGMIALSFAAALEVVGVVWLLSLFKVDH